MSNNSTFSPLMPGEEEREGKGTLAIVIVIIVLILIGGLFAINAKKTTMEKTEENPSNQIQTEEMSTSTKLDDIDKDFINLEASVNTTDIDLLGQEPE